MSGLMHDRMFDGRDVLALRGKLRRGDWVVIPAGRHPGFGAGPLDFGEERCGIVRRVSGDVVDIVDWQPVGGGRRGFVDIAADAIAASLATRPSDHRAAALAVLQAIREPVEWHVQWITNEHRSDPAVVTEEGREAYAYPALTDDAVATLWRALIDVGIGSDTVTA